MKKIYKIILLLFILIFLTTYSPNQLSFTAKKGNPLFEIQNIEVTNNYTINKKDIINKLDHIYKKNIFFIKSDMIEEPLKSITFLEKIEVKKKYPNTIIIKIYESQPIAILFKNKDKYVLDSSSNLIDFNEIKLDKEFPNIFGKDAENNFIAFFNQLKDNKFPSHKVKNYYYFQIDRWDLQILNGQTIKFPSDKRAEAIQQSVELLNREDFKDYKVIDLRIHGKIVVE